eukprot:TRINITY_DN7413_c0_g1_i1.p1 TRINITY_DN7413_c0_g1~~TRINITY_DN7413_c0_g1_i1.p1  ORF type:complete len:1444 (+),score=471.81 TRINITY_DN7413_c0_g1_i1:97-4332(+)
MPPKLHPISGAAAAGGDQSAAAAANGNVKAHRRLENVRDWDTMAAHYPGLAAVCLSPESSGGAGAAAAERLVSVFGAALARRRRSTPRGLRDARNETAQARRDLEQLQREAAQAAAERRQRAREEQQWQEEQRAEEERRRSAARIPPVVPLTIAVAPGVLPLLTALLEASKGDGKIGPPPRHRPGKPRNKEDAQELRDGGDRLQCISLLRLAASAGGVGDGSTAGTDEECRAVDGLAAWAAAQPGDAEDLGALQVLLAVAGREGDPEHPAAEGDAEAADAPPASQPPSAAEAAQLAYSQLLRAEEEYEAAAAKRGGAPSPPLLLSPSSGAYRRAPARSPLRRRREHHFPGMNLLAEIAMERAAPQSGITALDGAAGERVVYLPPLVGAQPPRHLIPEGVQDFTRKQVELLFLSAPDRKHITCLNAASRTTERRGDTRTPVRFAAHRARNRLVALELEQAAAEARRCFDDAGGFGELFGDLPEDQSGRFSEPELDGVRSQVIQELAAVRWAPRDPRVGVAPSPTPSPAGSIAGDPPEEMAQDEKDAIAQQAREADEACPDQTLVKGVRFAILAQTAYRVPTGAEFYERLRKMQASGSRATARDVLRRYTRDAEKQLLKVRDRLERLYLASGVTWRLVAHTKLSLPGLQEAKGAPQGVKSPVDQTLGAAPVVKQVSSLSRGGGGGGGESLENINPDDPPEVPPGWFLCNDRDHPQEVCVCVAGTQNADDVFRDVLFVPVPFEVPSLDPTDPEGVGIPDAWPGAMVHKGFLDGAQKLFRSIMPALLDLRAEEGALNLHFCGHSLGGATALLLAAFISALRPEGMQVCSLYTYGAPNVFHIEAWEMMQKPVPPMLQRADFQQYVNDRDIVPRALGSPAIVKLAKVAIRLGLRAMACVTAENADCLPMYRFVGPQLHLLQPDSRIATHTQRAEQEAVLRLCVTDLRPQGGMDHKQGNYLQRLLQLLNEKTGYVHQFVVKVDATSDAGTVHPLLEAVFRDDSTNLSDGFLVFAHDVFVRFARPPSVKHTSAAAAAAVAASTADGGGGIDELALLNLFAWSARLYPSYLVPERMLGGSYQLVPGTAPPQLSQAGWEQLLESACYGDIHWVARLVEATGWDHKGDRLKERPKTDPAAALCRADLVDPAPRVARVRLLSPEQQQLCAEGAAALQWVFERCALPLPAEVYDHPYMKGYTPGGACHRLPVMRTASLGALLAALELAACPELRDPAVIAAAANSAHLSAQAAVAELREQWEEAQARGKAKGAEGKSDSAPTPQGYFDAMGNLLLGGFVVIMTGWFRDDEPRAWAALLGIGFGHELDPPRPPEDGAWPWQHAAHDAHRAADDAARAELGRREELVRRATIMRLDRILRLRAISDRRVRSIKCGGFGKGGLVPLDGDHLRHVEGQLKDVPVTVPM